MENMQSMQNLQNKLSKPNLPKQNYQSKPTKSNLPKQTDQTKSISFFYYPRPQQKTDPWLFWFLNVFSITCFGLRPDHMVLYWQLNEKSYHIRSSSEDNFCFLSQSSLLSFTKGGKRLKTWTPQGLFSFLFSPPSLPSPPSSSDPSLPSQELLRAPPPAMESGPGVEDTSWEVELVAQDDGHGDLVHKGVGWMGPPEK